MAQTMAADLMVQSGSIAPTANQKQLYGAGNMFGHDEKLLECALLIKITTDSLVTSPEYIAWEGEKAHNAIILSEYAVQSFCVQAELVGDKKLYRVNKVFLIQKRGEHVAITDDGQYTKASLLEGVPPRHVGDTWKYLEGEVDWFEDITEAQYRYIDDVRKNNDVAIPKVNSLLDIQPRAALIQHAVDKIDQYIPKKYRHFGKLNQAFIKKYDRRMTDDEYDICSLVFARSREKDLNL